MFLEKDIYLIFKLAFQEATNKVFVLDPQKQIVRNYRQSGFNYVRTREDIRRLGQERKPYFLINTSGARTFNFPIDFENVEGVITFNRFLEVSELFYHHELFYSKKKNQAISWVYNSYYRDPDFLVDTDEFETVIAISNLASFFPSTLKYIRFWLGDLKGVSDGSIQILSKKDSLWGKKEDKEGLSVRLKAAAVSEVLEIRLKKGRTQKQIIKYPVTKAAVYKTEHEFSFLEKFGNQKASVISVEKSEFYHSLRFNKKAIPVSAVNMHKKYYPSLVDNIIAYNKDYLAEVRLESYLRKNETLRSLEAIKLQLTKKNYPRGMGVYNFTNILTNLTRTLNSFSGLKTIAVTLANCDIRNTHLAASGNQITITSWLLAEPQYPPLFDLFDLEFKWYEQQENPDAQKLVSDLKYMESLDSVQSFLDQCQTDFITALNLYLLTRLPIEMILALRKDKIVPEQNLKFFLWSEFFNYFRLEQNKE